MKSLFLFFATAFIATNNCVAQDAAFKSEKSQGQLQKSCMRDMWEGLLPLIAKGGYITTSDMEHLAGIKMKTVVDIAPGDTIATYEEYGRTPLSIRIEDLKVPSSYGIGHMRYTWQVIQGHSIAAYGSSSIVDFSCLDESLQLSKVEADLFSIGYHRIGFTAQEIHAEYFAGRGNVVVYFDVPAETVSKVTSLHIEGARIEPVKSSSAH